MNARKRVVFDTNMLLSALAFSIGCASFRT